VQLFSDRKIDNLEMGLKQLRIVARKARQQLVG
jgi:hypothetical protein